MSSVELQVRHKSLPSVNEVWGKVMFSEVFVSPQGVSV